MAVSLTCQSCGLACTRRLSLPLKFQGQCYVSLYKMPVINTVIFTCVILKLAIANPKYISTVLIEMRMRPITSKF